MFYTGLFKRIIPFLLTFAAGLMVASLFVPLAFPNLSEWRNARRSRGFHEKRQLRMENEELREKYRTLKKENEELRRGIKDWDADSEILNAVPPVELEEHHPPTPPRKPKHPRFVRVQ